MQLLFRYKKTLVLFGRERNCTFTYGEWARLATITTLCYFGAIGFEPMTSWSQIKCTNSTVLCSVREKQDSNLQPLVRQTNALPLSYSPIKFKNIKKLNSFSSSIYYNKKENSHYINKMSISSCTLITNMITFSKMMFWETS